MPRKPGIPLVTITLVLTDEQVAQLRQIAELRRLATANNATVSEIAREVVSIGLAGYFAARRSHSGASHDASGSNGHDR